MVYFSLSVVLCSLLILVCCTWPVNSGHKRGHHKTRKSSVQRNIHPVSMSLEHSMPWKEISISKKSVIEHPVITNTKKSNNDERKQKRGFLANLANLLTDAEKISRHKNGEETSPETGLSSLPLSPEKNLVEMLSNRNNDQEKNSEPTSNTAKKEAIVGSVISTSTKEINDAVTESGKDYAPVFAMYHGKVITLGKLPDTAFKRSRLNNEEATVATATIPAKSNIEIPRVAHVENIESHVKDKTGSKRYLEDNKMNDKLDSSPNLQEYLKTLENTKTKDTRGVAKDQVPSPLDITGTIRSDLMGHIKSVVLDDGKIVSLANNHVESNVSPIKQNSELPDAQQKYFVNNEGSVEPLLKSKPEDVDAVTRDNLLDSSSIGGQQKTVTLTVDVLKDLLKRTDSKVSLANLLNKPAEGRSDTPQEDEDPGTIEDFAASGLKSHNAYRAKHHDDALVWNDDLAAKAQKLAEALADKKTLEIAKDLEKDGMGENVAKVWATFKNAGDAATKMWYSQSSNYRFDDPHLDENTGQFAQVVWKSTRELGMGVAKSIDDVNNKYVYVTALYRPPGNIEATLRENVLPIGNNTIDVYSTFFKRTGVISKENHNSRRSKIQKHKKKHKLKLQDGEK